ncbi:MAG: tetratricopeptide repeat protein, partial [Planctomycetota bacterium]
LATGPDRPKLLVEAAMFYLEQCQDPDQAIVYASRAVELAPNGPAQVFALARALEQSGQTDRARSTYLQARALVLDPNHSLVEEIDEALRRLEASE